MGNTKKHIQSERPGSSIQCAFKVTVVGCGNVGSTIAYALLLDGTPTDLALIDLNKEKAEGILLDLEHSLPFTSFTKLTASDNYAECAGSSIVIITAGKRQAEGQTRLQLLEDNKKIFRDMIPKIAAAAPNAILIVITNPVDVLTYETLKASKFSPQKVFGTGTMLDTARLQFHLSEKLKIHPRSIDAYILGEHGDSSFPVWSSANVMGKPICEFADFSQKVADQCYTNTRDAAYRIIHDVGFTCYSIATATCELVKNIFADTHQVFPLSTLLQDYYGINDVCLSVPCVIGRNGIVQTLKIPLSDDEQKKLANSASLIKSLL